MLETPRHRVVVEARKDPLAAHMLNALAENTHSLGHEVIRWRGPLSGRVPYSRHIPLCDAVILYNGAHEAYEPYLKQIADMQAAKLHVELGWFPQVDNYQLDPHGVNAGASWCLEPLGDLQFSPVQLKPHGDVLVLLQLENDTQITRYSPSFRHMKEFVQFVTAHSVLPVRVRAHPLCENKTEIEKVVQQCGARWDDTRSLTQSLDLAKAVACINSSAAVAALHYEIPVLCYGEAVYRQPAAVYCLTKNAAETEQVTKQLQNNHCLLSQTAMREIVARIQQAQWKISDVPQRLPSLLEKILSSVTPYSERVVRPNQWQRAQQWICDLPAKVLYRHRHHKISKTA